MDLAGDFFSSLTAIMTTSSWSSTSILHLISFRISFSSPTACSPSKALIANKFRVSKVRFWLSSILDPWSDLWLNASGLPIVFLGQWCKRKSNLAKSNNHWACLWFSFLAVMKYLRFLWSVQISNWCSVPSRKCLHSSSTRTFLCHGFCNSFPLERGI